MSFSYRERRKLIKSKITRKYKRYEFCKSRDGEWIYKHNLPYSQRKTLNLARRFLKWLIYKRDENLLVNKKILGSMGLDPDTDVSSLDAFYKKEFRKKKYIYFFKYKPQRDLPEPRKAYFAFIPETTQFYKKSSSMEFLKTFSNNSSSQETK